MVPCSYAQELIRDMKFLSYRVSSRMALLLCLDTVPSLREATSLRFGVTVSVHRPFLQANVACWYLSRMLVHVMINAPLLFHCVPVSLHGLVLASQYPACCMGECKHQRQCSGV